MIDRANIVRHPAPPPTGRTWTLRLDTGPGYPVPRALNLAPSPTCTAIAVKARKLQQADRPGSLSS